MRSLKEKATYANVAATLALLVALGGGAYAAALPRGSVDTAQLKKSAVTSSKLAANSVKTGKVANGSLLAADFASGQIPEGPEGPEGPQGPQGPQGPFPNGDMPSGKTIRGSYANAVGPGAVQILIGQSFGFRMASAPTPHRIGPGETPTTECPGTSEDPQALAGHLCVYEMSYDNVNAGCAGVAVFNPNTNTCSIAGRSGFGIVYDLVSSGGSAFTMGSWAVTSP